MRTKERIMSIKDTFFSKKSTINCRGKLVDLSEPKVMGVLNITPDSFYDGGKHDSIDKIKQQTKKMIEEGADFIDVGGYSSRPGAENIKTEEEEKRLFPVLEMIRKNYPDVIISVDTFRHSIAEKVVKNFEVDMINDISAGEMDEKMFETVADLKVPYIIMHMKGTPQNMKEMNQYDDMMSEIIYYFSEKYARLKKMGVPDIIIDPGFGFAKDIKQNFELLKNLDSFKVFELPMLVGLSRKSMIYKSLGTTPDEALTGTIGLNMLALEKGADVLRVHDVKQAKETIQLFQNYSKSETVN